MLRDKVRAYRRKVIQEESEARQRTEDIENKKMLEGLLRKAVKRLNVDIIPLKRGVLDIMDLSYAQQIDILEKYVIRIDDEIENFSDEWGDDYQVQHAISWFKLERGNALDQLARLKITIAQGEPEPRKPNYQDRGQKGQRLEQFKREGYDLKNK